MTVGGRTIGSVTSVSRNGGVKPMGEGQTDDAEDEGRDGGEAQGEAERLPKGRRQTEESEGRIAHQGDRGRLKP
jgi:hypothetical protein